MKRLKHAFINMIRIFYKFAQKETLFWGYSLRSNNQVKMVNLSVSDFEKAELDFKRCILYESFINDNNSQ